MQENEQIIYVILLIIMYYFVKPSLSFKPNGTLREFGVGYSHDGYKRTFFTLFNLIVFLIIVLVK